MSIASTGRPGGSCRYCTYFSDRSASARSASSPSSSTRARPRSADPPEPAPVVLVVVDEDGDVRPFACVVDAAQSPRPFRLVVDGRVERVAFEREGDRHQVRPAVGVDRREARDARGLHALPEYDRVVHVGIILPNFDEHASPAGVRAVAEAAEELGFDSVWATEHIIVGTAGRARPYRRVLDPLCTLSWIAGYTQRIGLGTSIVLVPLHHPIHLAKEAASLQELSGGRAHRRRRPGLARGRVPLHGHSVRGRGAGVPTRRCGWSRRCGREQTRSTASTGRSRRRSSRRFRPGLPRSGSAAARTAPFVEPASSATPGIPPAASTPRESARSSSVSPSFG